MSPPTVSVVVPTRNRAGYLDVALRSLVAQRLDAAHEVLVVDDGSSDLTAETVAGHGVRCVRFAQERGLNAARNAGMGATSAPLVVFVDDDVEAPPGWLRAYVEGAARHPDADALGGPIRARFEGPTPHGCGRELPPITTLDLGREDRPAPVLWGTNMAIRREAFERIGPFAEDIHGGGDEEEWFERLRRSGGTAVYLADAGLVHRRAGDDARLAALMRSAYRRGRGVRAWDDRRGAAPGLGRELRVVLGCGWHTVRRRCPQGLVMAAHSAGRTVEALRPRIAASQEPETPAPAEGATAPSSP